MVEVMVETMAFRCWRELTLFSPLLDSSSFEEMILGTSFVPRPSCNDSKLGPTDVSSLIITQFLLRSHLKDLYI